jgi:hypothetical protein
VPYQDEDAIKAELRALAERTRKLRQDLQGLITGPQADLTRAHVQAGPKASTDASSPVAAERPNRRRKKKVGR